MSNLLSRSVRKFTARDMGPRKAPVESKAKPWYGVQGGEVHRKVMDLSRFDDIQKVF